MNDDIRYRLNYIRDSLIGVSYHLPDPQVMLYPFLDNNLLLHQSPLIYNFWEGDECVFSSLKDPDYVSKHSIRWLSPLHSRIPIRKTPYALSVHDFPSTALCDVKCAIEIPIHENATCLTKALLNESDGFALPDNFFTSLGTSISAQQFQHQQELDRASQEPERIEMDYGEVKELLEPIRLALDGIFEDCFRSRYLMIEKGSLTYPNVFAVVRSCPTASHRYNGVFDYTVGLVLLSKMKSVLEEWCASKCLCELKDYGGKCPLQCSSAEECLQSLEYPLGSNSRSVSDLVFSSGIVDFGRQAREKEWDASVAGDPFDERRRAIERCVYPQGWRLFYIPVHVGGTPWLALFTFTPQDPASNPTSWHHNYSFYRDLAQKAAALIRKEAHDAYKILLAKHFVKHMESWITPMDTILSRINHDCQKLAQVYPFQMAHFTRDDKSTNRIFVTGRGIVSMHFKPNPFFRCQVSWNLGDDQALLRQCREAIGDFTRIEQSIEVNAVAQSSHLLKIPLRVLDSIATSVAGEKSQALHRQIRKILDLHDVASSLVSEKKRKVFRQQYQREGFFKEIEHILLSQFTTSTEYLCDPAVSGNLAPRIKKLLSEDCIDFKAKVSGKNEVSYLYYEPLVVALLDGLLTNAIDRIDSSNPRILLTLEIGPARPNYRGIFLCIENTTDIDQDRLLILVRDLNSPGPDLVGITELHWMSKACWPHISNEDRLSWTMLKSPERVVARALIAEVKQ